MNHIERGNRGEKEAISFLKRNHYDIIACNFRFKRAEIDVIAVKDNELIFVEVKTRSSYVKGKPEDAVTHRKQRQILMAAQGYISENNREEEVRFDVISVVYHKNQLQISHIQNAFYSLV